jgi:5,10-methylenetetrahydrofolate reductase
MGFMIPDVPVTVGLIPVSSFSKTMNKSSLMGLMSSLSQGFLPVQQLSQLTKSKSNVVLESARSQQRTD